LRPSCGRPADRASSRPQYPGTTRERAAAPSWRSRGSPRTRISSSPLTGADRPGPATDFTIRTDGPRSSAGVNEAVDEARRRALNSQGLRRGDRGEQPGTPAELSKAAREHLPLVKHIALVNEMEMLSSGLGNRRLGGPSRAASKPSLHALRPGPWDGPGATGLPVDPFYLSYKAREPTSTNRVHRARREDQPEPAALGAFTPESSGR